jgi:hypothetical protein
MEIDEDDLEALGFGSQMEQLAFSGWAERKLEQARDAVGTYQRTPRGRKMRAKAQRSYAKTAKGRATQDRYLKNRGYARMKEYLQTEAGKAAKSRANARYRAKVKARDAARD